MRILHITTIPMSLTFLRGQVGYMKEHGYTVHAMSSPGEELDEFGIRECVPVHSVSMTRRITPLKDLIALLRIRRGIVSIMPTIVHAHTPKGGVLGMLAAASTNVPARVYHMRGLPFVTARGMRRILLKSAERISCALAHSVICNSHSMRRVALDEGICPPRKIKVLKGGSGNGVDASGRFDPTTLPPSARGELRGELGIPEGAMVIGFVGRLVREKGIGELELAWQKLRDRHPQLHLLIVGPYETNDPLPGHTIARLQRDSRVHLLGLDWDTPRLYATMDIVTLPTYREGFPNVPLEAAAMALPVVGTAVPGCVDAIRDGETGILVPARDADALAEALEKYIRDPELRRAHGRAGRERVLREFRQEEIWHELASEYARLPSGRMGYRGKRLLDLFGALALLAALSPVIGLVALIVRSTMGRPVLFKQRRPGRDGELFTMYKFRTMIEAFDEHGRPLPDDRRLTRIGNLLRMASLDELPELVNVLMGEMSLVGPRPLLEEYLTLYTPEQSRRHAVLPGVTGWAQVNGRNATTWETRLAMDAWYVDNLSLRLDLAILMRTLVKVLFREGINQRGSVTMKPFRGTAS